MQNNCFEIAWSETLISGILVVQNKINKLVSNCRKQEPSAELGLDSFEFWTAERRPKGKNLALEIIRQLLL